MTTRLSHDADHERQILEFVGDGADTAPADLVRLVAGCDQCITFCYRYVEDVLAVRSSIAPERSSEPWQSVAAINRMDALLGQVDAIESGSGGASSPVQAAKVLPFPKAGNAALMLGFMALAAAILVAVLMPSNPNPGTQPPGVVSSLPEAIGKNYLNGLLSDSGAGLGTGGPRPLPPHRRGMLAALVVDLAASGIKVDLRGSAERALTGTPHADDPDPLAMLAADPCQAEATTADRQACSAGVFAYRLHRENGLHRLDTFDALVRSPEAMGYLAWAAASPGASTESTLLALIQSLRIRREAGDAVGDAERREWIQILGDLSHIEGV